MLAAMAAFASDPSSCGNERQHVYCEVRIHIKAIVQPRLWPRQEGRSGGNHEANANDAQEGTMSRISAFLGVAEFPVRCFGEIS